MEFPILECFEQIRKLKKFTSHKHLINCVCQIVPSLKVLFSSTLSLCSPLSLSPLKVKKKALIFFNFAFHRQISFMLTSLEKYNFIGDFLLLYFKFAIFRSAETSNKVYSLIFFHGIIGHHVGK